MCLMKAEEDSGKVEEDQQEESRILGHILTNRRTTKYKMSDVYV